SEPYFSEFSPGGQLLFDAHMPAGDQSYRAYRSPWTGTPREPPAIALVPTRPGGPLNVYASWNGATLLARWRLLGGPSPRRLAPLATAPRTGFETRLETPGAEGYVAVQALSGSGAVLGTSHVIRG
ncbi:MAG TPA: hypothetical protein VGX16_03510, partial [Solirubrobacteraceae bacterium]|nr:hypothetical protein [Solirubrobacteraceae bacterium]